MNSRIKDYLGIAGIIAILVAAYAAGTIARSYSKNSEPTSFRSFSVTADGKVTAKPDVARFTFSVISEGGKDIAALQQDNSDKTSKAIDFVKSKGVDAKDITTQQYDIRPRQQYFNCPIGIVPLGQSAKPCPPPEIVGYTITQTVEVKIRDFKTIGDILGGVVNAGANDVSQLSFVIDDPSALQDAARAEAIKKAQKRAQAIADAGGFGLGRLLSIDENGNNPQPIYAMDKAMSSASAGVATAAPTIEPGSQDVQTTVTLRYEIQ